MTGIVVAIGGVETLAFDPAQIAVVSFPQATIPATLPRRNNLQIVSLVRLFWILTLVGLAFFSSTPTAGAASEYAFHFYRKFFALSPSDSMHGFFQKGVHFLLFFALGTALYYGLNLTRLWKVFGAVGICLLVGIGSEGTQLLFLGRHASVGDVLLNAASGTLATMLATRSPHR